MREQITRRNFISSAAATMALAHISPGCRSIGVRRTEYPSSMGLDITTVAEASKDFPRHDTATVIERGDGSLMIAWMEYVGSALIGHDHAPCNIASMISRDGGYTWSDRRILVENHPDDANIHFPWLLRLPGGQILFYYLIRHYLRPREVARSSGILCRSTDECKTFSTPVRHEVLSKLGGNGRILSRLSSGRLILPSQRYQHGIWGGPRDHQIVGCCYSDDQGDNWQESNWVDLPKRGAMEPHVVELRDGRLLMYMRTQLGAIFQSQSTDQAVTWSKPQTTGLRAPESMPCLTRIPSTGDLLLVWNHSDYDPQFDHYGKRTPLTVGISRDDGHSWQNICDIETNPEFEFTNPSCHFTSQNKVIITYVASKMRQSTGRGSLGRSRMSLKAAIADLQWFYSSG